MRLSAALYSTYATVLSVNGDIDGDSYGAVLVEAEQLLARNTRLLVVDLTDCAYMSSAGVVVMTTLYKRMRDLTRSEASASWATKNVLERAGELGPPRALGIANPNPAVLRVLEMAGIPSFIPVFATAQDAISVMNS